MLESQDLRHIARMEVTLSESGGRAGRGEQGAHMYLEKNPQGVLIVFLLLCYFFFWEHCDKVFQISFLMRKYVVYLE